MIKVENLNKYFNKGKQNEIHVINNTTLEFPEKGLITLLGDSGSGKTTLLNVIGGLDKTSGIINFKDEKLSFYNSKVWDKLRVNNIGYIFQNYYLLEDRSITDNIKIVLTMMGITDEEEIDYRIKYVLDAVGMYRFRNKLASDLSGGQKQRVAIARAIVKNPDVIIADEPTGNLDSNNSIEVLKIIKEISKDKLVVLVTHNMDLASHYSDRIIKISDGKVVNDNINESGLSNLDYVDHNIYLKDLNKVNSDQINIYSNEDLSNVNLTIVKINNNYYLKSNEKNITVKILTNESELKLLDEHKKDVTETFTKETQFNLEELESKKSHRTKSTVYSFKDSIIEALKKLTNLGKKGKIQIAALIYLGIMFTTSFLLFTSAVFMDTSKIDHDKNAYVLEYGRNFVSGENFPTDIYIYNLRDGVYFYNGSFSSNMRLKIYPKEAIGKENTPKNEVYIDESVLDKNYESKHLFEAFGINKKEHLINQKVSVGNIREELVIKGTVRNGYHAIYVDSDLLLEQLVYNVDYAQIYNDDVVLNESLVTTYPGVGHKIYISEQLFGMEEEYFASYNFRGINFSVAGYYVDDSDYPDYGYYIKKADFKPMALENINLEMNLYNLGEQKLPDIAKNRYQMQYDDLKQIKSISLATSITQSLIALGISVLIFYFLVRSSMTSRRKEISILRSLGISKGEVRKLFAVEYFIITTATSLIGVLIGSYVANSINNSFLEGMFNLRVNGFTFLLAVFLVYVVNIVVSLIPVTQMLSKTPADLLTHYDL